MIAREIVYRPIYCSRKSSNEYAGVDSRWAATAPAWIIDITDDVSQTKGEEAMTKITYTSAFQAFTYYFIVVSLAIILIIPSSAVHSEQIGNTVGSQLITIDPRVHYDVSGRNDIKLMRGYFQGASWEMPISQETWQHLQPLGISKIRLINVESQNMIQIETAKNEMKFNFSSLLAGLQDCLKYGLKPHIIVGQRQQVALSISKNGKSYGVSDWSLYEKYAYEFLKFVMVEQGFARADFEVANEPDINGAAWLLPDKLPNGDPAMYQAYLQLYQAWARAADRLMHEHPELNLRIGGPALTAFTFAFGKLNWYDQFSKDVATQKLRLDFFSFHFYGNTAALAGLSAFGRYPTFVEQIVHIRNNLKNAGLGNVPIYVTEWGPSYVTSETPEGIINGNYIGAAWSARFFVDMAENKVDEGLALTLRDHLVPTKLTNNWGWPSLLLSDGVTQKALYNVALMFVKLPDQRVKASATRGSVGVVASADKTKVGVLAFNQDWNFSSSKERANSERVQIQIVGLPFPASRVRVTRYLVDENHSDAYGFYKRGLPISPENVGLKQVEDMIVPVTKGAVSLKDIVMAPSSVTLWEITPVVQ
jgi:xylan 1,4-beta-xylosidase